MPTTQGYPLNRAYPVYFPRASLAYPGLGAFGNLNLGSSQASAQMLGRAITNLIALSQYVDSLVAATLADF